MHFAAATENPELVRLLRAYRARIDLINEWLKTPTDVAKEKKNQALTDALRASTPDLSPPDIRVPAVRAAGTSGSQETTAQEGAQATDLPPPAIPPKPRVKMGKAGKLLGVNADDGPLPTFSPDIRKEEEVVVEPVKEKEAEPEKEREKTPEENAQAQSRQLHRCARDNNLQGVQDAVRAGGDVNWRNGQSSMTALHICAKGNFFQIGLLLLESGADPNVQTTSGWTALHFAVSARSKHMIMLLRAFDARIDIINEWLKAPSDIAKDKETPELVPLLLLQPAEVDIQAVLTMKTEQEEEAEKKAQEEAAAEVAKQEEPTPKGGEFVPETPPKQEEKVSEAVSKPEETSQEETKEPHQVLSAASSKILHKALIRAVRCNHSDDVLSVLKEGADPNEGSSKSNTVPLHIAAKHGYDDCCRALVKGGALVNFQTKSGWTALHFAAVANLVDTVQLLLELGAKDEIRNEMDATPSFLAKQKGFTTVVNLIQDFGKEKNEIPSSDAAAEGFVQNQEVVPQAQRVAAVTVRENRNESLDMSSLHLSQEDFSSPGGQVNLSKQLQALARRGDVEGCGHALDSGADPNWKNPTHGVTSVHIAAKSGHTKVVELLLERGGLVNAQNKSGWTALHFAVGANNADMVRVLMVGGARVDLVNEWLKTPLDLAKEKANDDVLLAIRESRKAPPSVPLLEKEVRAEGALLSGSRDDSSISEAKSPRKKKFSLFRRTESEKFSRADIVRSARDNSVSATSEEDPSRVEMPREDGGAPLTPSTSETKLEPSENVSVGKKLANLLRRNQPEAQPADSDAAPAAASSGGPHVSFFTKKTEDKKEPLSPRRKGTGTGFQLFKRKPEDEVVGRDETQAKLVEESLSKPAAAPISAEEEEFRQSIGLKMTNPALRKESNRASRSFVRSTSDKALGKRGGKCSVSVCQCNVFVASDGDESFCKTCKHFLSDHTEELAPRRKLSDSDVPTSSGSVEPQAKVFDPSKDSPELREKAPAAVVTAVQYGEFAIDNTVVRGPGVANGEQGDQAVFFVETKDQDGRVWFHPDMSVEASIRVTGAKVRKLKAQVRVVAPGMFEVKYARRVPGLYEIEVFIDGESLSSLLFVVETAQSAPASKFEVEHKAQHTASKEQQFFVVRAFDSTGAPHLGHNELLAQVTCDEKPRDCRVGPNERGTYRVFYDQSVAGKYTAIATANGQAVPGCPFSFDVLQGAEDSRGSALLCPELKVVRPTVAQALEPAIVAEILLVDEKGSQFVGDVSTADFEVYIDGKRDVVDVGRSSSTSLVVKYMTRFTKSGEKTVQVLHRGKELRGSPFKVFVEQTLDLSKVKVSGDGLLDAPLSEELRFVTVSALDLAGDPVFALENLLVDVVGPGKAKIATSEHVSNASEFSFSYVRSGAGTYTVRVSIRGADVAGSPFTVVASNPARTSSVPKKLESGSDTVSSTVSIANNGIPVATKTLTYAQMKGNKRAFVGTDVDVAHLEAYLSDAEFVHVFGEARREFYQKPVWKRLELKKKAQLF